MVFEGGGSVWVGSVGVASKSAERGRVISSHTSSLITITSSTGIGGVSTVGVCVWTGECEGGDNGGE